MCDTTGKMLRDAESALQLKDTVNVPSTSRHPTSAGGIHWTFGVLINHLLCDYP